MTSLTTCSFATPLCVGTRPQRTCFASHMTSWRSANPHTMSANPRSDDKANNEEKPETVSRVWDGVKKVIRISAISAGVFLTPGLSMAQRRAGSALPTITTTMQARAGETTHTAKTSQAGNSDVEAAAMTLGAVTLGGLVMRAIITKSRDETAEREKLQAECKRLEEEEEGRARRAERRKLETVEASEIEGDEDLWVEFRKRVENMDNDDVTLDASSAKKDDNMRHSPIPDRGTGSALLDRPQSVDGGAKPNSPEVEGGDGEGSSKNADEEQLANPDDMEMLKRMWNLSPPDKE